MGLVSGKIIIVLLLLFVGFGWSLGNGYVSYKGDGYKCVNGKWWYSEVPKQRLWAVGKLSLFYQPLDFGCTAAERYDPQTYEVQNGALVPKPSATPGSPAQSSLPSFR